MNKNIFSIVVFVLFAMPLHADPSGDLAVEEGHDTVEAGATTGQGNAIKGTGEHFGSPGELQEKVDANTEAIGENRAWITINTGLIDETQQVLVDFGIATAQALGELHETTGENRESITINAGRIDETQQVLVDFGLEIAKSLEDINANLMMAHTQLGATQSLVLENTEAIRTNAMRLQALGEQADKNTAGVSMALAAANIPPIAEGSRVALGVGIGTFDGKTSAALGGSVRVNERVSIRASLSSSSGEVGAGLGFGVSF